MGMRRTISPGSIPNRGSTISSGCSRASTRFHLTIHYLDPLPDIVEGDRKLLAEAARASIAAEIARSSAGAPHRL
jgi:hypothetical protein